MNLKRDSSTDNFKEVSLTYKDSYLLYYSCSQFYRKFFILVSHGNYRFLNPLCYNTRRLLNLNNMTNIAWTFHTLPSASNYLVGWEYQVLYERDCSAKDLRRSFSYNKKLSYRREKVFYRDVFSYFLVLHV